MIAKHKLLIVAVLLVVAYWTIAPLFSVDNVSLLLNSIAMVIGVAVTAIYIRPAAVGLIYGKRDRVTQLIMGITLSFLTLFLNRTGLMFANGYVGTLFFPFVSYLVILAGILHITPSNQHDGSVSGWSWVIVWASIFWGAVLAALIHQVNAHVF